jgi:DNA-directed RNA polymerase subunit L
MFVFTVESECAMTPDYLVFKAISILCDNIETLIRDIESENDEKVKLEPLGDVPHMYQLSLFGQTHTMGNLLQAQFYNKFVRQDGSKTLEYVGYVCPHPLDKTILIKLKFASSTRDDLIRQWIIDSVRTIYHDMFRLGKQWLSFASVIEDEYDDVVDYIKHGNSIPEPVATNATQASQKDEKKVQEQKELQDNKEPIAQEQQEQEKQEPEKQEPEKQEEPEIKEIIVVKPKRAPAKKTKK